MSRTDSIPTSSARVLESLRRYRALDAATANKPLHTPRSIQPTSLSTYAGKVDLAKVQRLSPPVADISPESLNNYKAAVLAVAQYQAAPGTTPDVSAAAKIVSDQTKPENREIVA